MVNLASTSWLAKAMKLLMVFLASLKLNIWLNTEQRDWGFLSGLDDLTRSSIKVDSTRENQLQSN